MELGLLLSVGPVRNTAYTKLMHLSCLHKLLSNIVADNVESGDTYSRSSRGALGFAHILHHEIQFHA